MTTLINYLQTIGTQSFTEQPLNATDILLLTELLYLPVDDVVPHSLDSFLSLEKIAISYLENHPQHFKNNAFLASEARAKLMEHVGQSTRFKHLKLAHFINEVHLEDEMQFAAATYQIDENHYLVVFRGTDDTLVGWKEDFKISYLQSIPAQQAAVNYLQQTLEQLDGHIYVSGHSKGGNLAIFACAHLAPTQFERLIHIYAFDAPGFNATFLEKDSYRQLENKLSTYVPEDAIIGQLMQHASTPHVVKSRAFGLEQHNSLNWEIHEGDFVYLDKVSTLSLIIDQTFAQWLDNRNTEELQYFFDTIFDVFKQADIASLNELSNDFWGSLKAIQQAISTLNEKDRTYMTQSFQDVLTIAFALMKQHQTRNFSQHFSFESLSEKFNYWFNDSYKKIDQFFNPIITLNSTSTENPDHD
ncbi:MAG: DUF2974 domain-containing protein [Aerococcaceae bacterium]|nr:DUF2974 domain-containing protein [Aerococcaceae bacterium]